MGEFPKGKIFRGREVPGDELFRVNLRGVSLPEFLYGVLFVGFSLCQLNFTCGDVPEEFLEVNYQ